MECVDWRNCMLTASKRVKLDDDDNDDDDDDDEADIPLPPVQVKHSTHDFYMMHQQEVSMW